MLEALCERLTAGSYSLLHIVCHGRYNQKGESLLYLPDARRKPVSGGELIERLARLQGPRGLPHFVFLMACESASPEAENGFGGLGQRLVRDLGVPAVLAMTASISIQTAGELAGSYYARLQAHGEVDRALSEALAGLMGRPDVTVPAIFSRLGGRPLFSDALDRPLTASEIQFGVERLGEIVQERAPVLDERYNALRPGLQAQASGIDGLSAAARQELAAALDEANALSDEIADLSFNALALGRPLPPYDPRCPFRGLASFRPEDRLFFFGREALVERLVERLEAHPFLAVLGPSGSGKSSLVLAGLVPALEQRMAGCEEPGIFAYLTPGAEPLERLQAAQAGAAGCALVVIDQFEELFTLCRDEGQRAAFIQHILALSPSQRLVLTMRADFWGECASYPALKDEMQAHQELVGALDAAGLRRAIEQQAAVVGLRFEAGLAEDILQDVQGEPGAMPLLQHALMLLWERRHGRWLRAAEYRDFGGVGQAIAHTADGIYHKLEPPDQERLQAIFLRLTRLDDDPTPGIERRDTRRRVSLDELVPAGSARAETVELVRRLADARLLVTSANPLNGQEEVEVAHEALIRHWQRLGDWLAEDRSALRRGERVREAARQWEESQRQDDSLLVHRGGRLEEALELVEAKKYAFNQSEIDYLLACQALRERERRAQERRRAQWLVASLAAAAIFAALAVFGFLQFNRASQQAATATYALGLSDQRGTDAAQSLSLSQQRGTQAAIQTTKAVSEGDRAEKQARIARAGELAAQSQNSEINFPRRALLLVHQAVQVLQPGDPYIPYVENVLREVLGQIGGLTLTGHTDPVRILAFSQDSRWLASGSSDRTLRLWDMQQPQVEQVVLGGYGSNITTMAFSPNGRWLASGSSDPFIEDDTVQLWDVQNPKAEPMVLYGHQGPISTLAFSPNGRWLASGSMDGTIRLWDVQQPEAEPMVVDGNEGYIANLIFSLDGHWLASGSGSFFESDPQGNNVLLWDMENLQAEPVVLRGHTTPVTTLAFSPYGTWLASGSLRDNIVLLWDMRDPQSNPIVLRGHENEVTTLAFSPDERWLASGSYDKTVRLWDLWSVEYPEQATPLVDDLVLSGHEDAISSLAFSPDGNWLASGSVDQTVRLWNMQDPQTDLIVLRGHEGSVFTLAFSPDGRWLASGGGNFDGPQDHTVRLWDMQQPLAWPVVLGGESLAVSQFRWSLAGFGEKGSHCTAVGCAEPASRAGSVYGA